jgi:hypothetical protein
MIDTTGDFDCGRGFSGYPKGEIMKDRKELEKLAQKLRDGMDVRSLKKDDVIALQEYLLDIKDIELYDFLQAYW